MYIGIKDNKIFDIVSNLANKRDPDDLTVIYITIQEAITTYSLDPLDYRIGDTLIPSHLKDSDLRNIEPPEWSKWTDHRYEYYIDFEKRKQGFRVLNSNTTAEITFHFKPPSEGTYKILIGFGSTVITTINGTLNVGYVRPNGGGYNLIGYIDNVSFDLVVTDINELKTKGSTEFEVSNDKENIIVTWQKTIDNGSGYLFLLPFILRRVE